jgi:pyrophosphate--fructose-6-phosphate 1-phosphotransferase
VGVPKTIDGDLRMMPFLPITFGFHSATQHYCNLVQYLKIDSNATEKYWHIVKLMGRAASHVTLEVALCSHPNACVLSEEIYNNNWQLQDVVDYFSSIIFERYDAGQAYGVIVFPEGIVDVIPELKSYIEGDLLPLNDVLGVYGLDRLRQVSVDTDSHGNTNLSLIRVEDILLKLVQADVSKQLGSDDAVKFIHHFFGYTGRAVDPTPFDSAFSKLLGKTAYELVLSNITGVMAGVGYCNNELKVTGIPLNALMSYDKSKERYVIKKQLVEMMSNEYQKYSEEKDAWQRYPSDFYRRPAHDIPEIVRLNLNN